MGVFFHVSAEFSNLEKSMQRRQSLPARVISNGTPIARNRLRSAVEALETRRLFAVLTVNTSTDNTTPDSVLTLREAINVVDGNVNPSSLTTAEQAQINQSQPLGTNDTIDFNIPGSGVQDIAVHSNLPTISSPVT